MNEIFQYDLVPGEGWGCPQQDRAFSVYDRVVVDGFMGYHDGLISRPEFVFLMFVLEKKLGPEIAPDHRRPELN